MMRKGRLGRLARLGGMATGFVGDAAGATAHLVVGKGKAAEATFHRQAARRMLRVFGEMKGLPLKAGQMLSYIDEMLPEEHRHIYKEMLGNLQMHTPTMDWEAIETVFHEEFDGKGPTEVFKAFELEPIAAASIGQVYHAETHDGQEVAVKVQYPGVYQAIQSDLKNIDTMLSAMSAVMPRAQFENIVEDVVSLIEEECDYTIELQNQRDFRIMWEGDETVVIPRALDEFSTKRVLTSRFLHGNEWKEMQAIASDDEKSAYGEVIFKFVFQSLFGHGIFNGDPHPGNYMFFDDGRVAFIDYGCVQRYPTDQVEAFHELRHAVLDDSSGPGFRHMLNKVFGLPEDIDEELMTMLEDYMHLTFEPVTEPQPYLFTHEYCKKLLSKGIDAKMTLTKKMLRGRNVNVWEGQKRGVAFLGRINFGLGSILATLNTRADFKAILEQIPD